MRATLLYFLIVLSFPRRPIIFLVIFTMSEVARVAWPYEVYRLVRLVKLLSVRLHLFESEHNRSCSIGHMLHRKFKKKFP